MQTWKLRKEEGRPRKGRKRREEKIDKANASYLSSSPIKSRLLDVASPFWPPRLIIYFVFSLRNPSEFTVA